MPFPATPYDHDHENEVVLFGETNFRNQRRKFGFKTDDRRRHAYVIGKTGMGKTTLLENMVLADIYAGHGVCYIDPHGDTAEKFLDFVPPHRINDVVYFNPGDMEYPIGFNILETIDETQKHLVAAGLMGVFKKIWPDVWSSRMEYILLNTIMALLDYPGSTLLGINRLLSDEEYRKRVVSLIQDPVVKTFWVKEFAAFSEKYRTEAVAPLQNKVGQFLSATIIRNIVAQVKSTINIREIMDTRKIFIVNLSKGRIGEENSRLLGAMIITRIQLAAMERVDMPEKDRQDFYLYVDEFQNFATESFANILSEARKYRLNLTVAHQYIEQLDEMVRAAIFGNVGTLIAFRVGAADAVFMEQEFAPRFTPEDLVNLKKYEVYLKLMIDGASSEPFSANTLAPIAQRTGTMEKVTKVSRERYATPRRVIEEKVIKWAGYGTADTGQVMQTEDEIDEEEKKIAEKIKELETSSPNVGEMASPPDAGGFGKKKKDKKAEFKVPCSVCGTISELTFEPDWSKPWFCKEHLEMKKAGLLPKGAVKAPVPPKPVVAAPAVPVPPPVSLSALPSRAEAVMREPKHPFPATSSAPKPPAPAVKRDEPRPAIKKDAPKPPSASVAAATVVGATAVAVNPIVAPAPVPVEEAPAASDVAPSVPASSSAPAPAVPVPVPAPASKPVPSPAPKPAPQTKPTTPPSGVSKGSVPPVKREDKPRPMPPKEALAAAGIPMGGNKPRIVMDMQIEKLPGSEVSSVPTPPTPSVAPASSVAPSSAPVAPVAPLSAPPVAPSPAPAPEVPPPAPPVTPPPAPLVVPPPVPPVVPPPVPSAPPVAPPPAPPTAPTPPVVPPPTSVPPAPNAPVRGWQPGQVIKF